MHHIVYETKNLINQKIYVGVHSHKNALSDSYKGSGRIIKNAIKKYGTENFERRVISEFEDSEGAYFLESLIVDEQFLSRKDVYNKCLGVVEILILDHLFCPNE